MKNKWLQRLSIFLGIFYGIFYLISIYKYFIVFKLDKLISSFALLASIFTPFIVSRHILKKRVNLTHLFPIIFLSFIFASSYLGTVCDFYIIYPWWDIVLHSLAGIFFTLLGIYLINIFTLKRVIGYIKSPLLISFISFCFSVTATTLWEIFEYSCDILLKTDMTNLSLDDTMSDIIAGSLGSLVTFFAYYLIYRNGNHKKFQ